MRVKGREDGGAGVCEGQLLAQPEYGAGGVCFDCVVGGFCAGGESRRASGGAGGECVYHIRVSFGEIVQRDVCGVCGEG